MIYQSRIGTVALPTASGASPQTLQLNNVPLDVQVTGLLFRMVANWGVAPTGDLIVNTEDPDDTDNGLDAFLDTQVTRVTLTSPGGTTTVVRARLKDLRKLYLLKAGQDVRGAVSGTTTSPVAGPGTLVAGTSGGQTTVAVVPVSFDQPRLQDPYLFCPSGRLLRGASLTIEFGDATFGGTNDSTIQANSTLTVYARWIRSSAGLATACPTIIEYGSAGSPKDLGFGLTTHVFDPIPPAGASVSSPLTSVTYTIDGPETAAYQAASAASLTEQYQADCAPSYVGFGDASYGFGRPRTGMARVATPLRHILPGSSVRDLWPSTLAEMVDYEPSTGARVFVVERILPCKGTGSRVLPPRGATPEVPEDLLPYMPRRAG